MPQPTVHTSANVYEEKIVAEEGLSGTTKRRTYAFRTRKDKTKWIAQFGGSVETEGCVQSGLDWLVRHQADDGSWSNECLGPKRRKPSSKCEAAGTCTVPGQNHVMVQDRARAARSASGRELRIQRREILGPGATQDPLARRPPAP